MKTCKVFVPYGIPSVGSYATTVYMDGIPVTDNKKNSMGKPEYGFYMTVTLSFNDFNGIITLLNHSRMFWKRTSVMRRSARLH